MIGPKIRKDLDKIKVYYEDGQRKVRCFCGKTFNRTIVRHLRHDHVIKWEDWCIGFVKLRNKGLSEYEIINKYKTKDNRLLFTSSVVQMEIQRIVEEKNIRLKIPRKKEITRWVPKDYTIGRKTLWSFKNRGSWAVHRGDYRGNWSPRIPRAMIELYSKEKDIILDPFAGGGTTLIETWLTNRQGIGLDISSTAIQTSKARIREMEDRAREDPRITLNKELKPIIKKGDALHLKKNMSSLGFQDNSINLVCTHPPYLNSLRYTATIDGDLSHISEPTEFCDQLQVIAGQIFDLLTENGTCTVLIGDVRKKKEIIPLGFWVMERFLEEEFRLKDIIIKAQHNDSSTRFWYAKKNMIDFLLAHEYLFIFGK